MNNLCNILLCMICVVFFACGDQPSSSQAFLEMESSDAENLVAMTSSSCFSSSSENGYSGYEILSSAGIITSSDFSLYSSQVTKVKSCSSVFSSSSEVAAVSSSSDIVAESSSSDKPVSSSSATSSSCSMDTEFAEKMSSSETSSSSMEESSSSVESSSSEVPSSSSVVESSSSVAESSSSSENDVSSSSEYYKLNWDYLNPSISYDTIIDSRDGQVYKTVVIGSQIWMAENLNYNYPEGKKSICYHDSAEYCVRFGRLYKQDVLSLVCPEGWHVPDSTEWETLVIYTGETNGVLKTDTGWKVWNGDPTISNGTNDYGFSVHSSGYMYTSATGLTYCDVSMLELVARFWLKGVSKIISISERNSSRPGYYDSSSGAYHIRCLKDD